MAVLTGKARAALPDSAFAYVEPGHEGEKAGGKTPDKYRHYPAHDARHVRAALSRIGQGDKFSKEAKAKVLEAAKKHGVDEGTDTGRSLESLIPEVRFIASAPGLEMRAAGDATVPHINGYAAVYGKLSRKLGGFVEVIEPRAFDHSVTENFPGVVCRYNHRDDMVLGTTAAGTLTITVDERGMQYDVEPPRSRADVMELVERRDVRYSSFAFRCMVPGEDDTWGTTEWGQPLRHLRNVQVVDVAPVLDPAYFDTSAQARSMTGAIESLARFVDAPVDEVRSYLAAGQAIKFFKRSDRPSAPRPVPSLDKDSSEARMLDDPAIALRNWRYDTDAPAQEGEQPTSATTTDERDRPTEAELRAAMKNPDQLCYKYTQGEPCVRPTGHQGDCKGVCWSRVNGLPCNKVQGHEDEHAPMPVSSRSAEDEGTETRENPEPSGEVTDETPEVPEATEEVPAERMFDAVKADAELAAAQLKALEFEKLLNA